MDRSKSNATGVQGTTASRVADVNGFQYNSEFDVFIDANGDEYETDFVFKVERATYRNIAVEACGGVNFVKQQTKQGGVEVRYQVNTTPDFRYMISEVRQYVICDDGSCDDQWMICKNDFCEFEYADVLYNVRERLREANDDSEHTYEMLRKTA